MSGEHTHDDLGYADAALTEDAIRLLSDRVSRLTAQLVAVEAQLAIPRAPQDVYDYMFGGKPSAPQTFGRRYTRLDLSALDPAAPGLEFTLRYLNITPLFAAGKSVGAIRPRLVRADGDMTAYDDIEISRDALDDDGVALKTFVYFEAGDGGATHWELKCIGGISSATVGTRYTKKAIIKDRG
jgi:hypothetical protein